MSDPQHDSERLGQIRARWKRDEYMDYSGDIPYLLDLVESQARALSALKSDIDKFWFHVAHAYDIEPREYFETEAPKNGFGSPLAQAAHHLWKRDPKVIELEARVTTLAPYVQHKPECPAGAALHIADGKCDCGLAEILGGDRPPEDRT